MNRSTEFFRLFSDFEEFMFFLESKAGENNGYSSGGFILRNWGAYPIYRIF